MVAHDVGTEAAGEDGLRTQLLDAASRVFARQGYDGARIVDIVREAGVSTGAVYGRFDSKNDLLREAVVRSAAVPVDVADGLESFAEVLARAAARLDMPLTASDAVRLEAHVAARREPEVARAIEEANERWRESIEPLLRDAIAEGTIAADLDPDAVLFFIRTVGLGLLLQRAAGTKTPDAAGWNEVLRRVIASVGRPGRDTRTGTGTSTDEPQPPTGDL